VLDGPPNTDNEEAVTRFGAVPLVGRLAPAHLLDRAVVERLAGGFDLAERLRPHFTGC
jgi:hypothetical protein